MKPFIRITRNPYEEPCHINLIVAASHGRQTGQVEIYARPDDLIQFAGSLRGFPKKDDDAAIWELGSERPSANFAFYFRFRVFSVGATGQCAIEFRFCNNDKPPCRELGEFSIAAEPADLDRLAALLIAFSKLEHEMLVWTGTDGRLMEKGNLLAESD